MIAAEKLTCGYGFPSMSALAMWRSLTLRARGTETPLLSD